MEKPTKKKSGFQTAENSQGPITQFRWRVACTVSILAAMFMAGYGVRAEFLIQSRWLFIGYWCIFLFFILLSMYIVILDIRYIRLQYAVYRREIYRQTLGGEEFRQALVTNLQKTAEEERSKPRMPESLN